MINRRHIEALNVVSVIQFSILANYLLFVNIDFSDSLSPIIILKVLFILASASCMYAAVVYLRRAEDEAKKEFHSETDPTRKAENSIDKLYSDQFSSSLRLKIIALLSSSIFSTLCFFIFEPILDSICNS